MKISFCLFFPLFFTCFCFAQPKDILVNWECNMEIEILSGRFDPATDTVAASGDFNLWARHNLIVDPLNTNYYISEFPDLIYNVQVGEPLVEYKFFYTPYVWENGNNKVHILTQEEYNAGEATISRAFNDITLATVTNQETTIQFTVDCNGAVSAINNQPFPVINTCHIAGGTEPLQWPDTGWPDNQIFLMIPMFDDGINGGDPNAGDKIFNSLVTFPPYSEFLIHYKYSINYGDGINNGGGNDNENGVGDTHIIELEQLLGSAQVLNVFGQMGLHQLFNKVYVPVELTSFTASIQSGVVSLNWTTATELNNLGFEVQRRIIESDFENIGFVPGFGTTTEPMSYTFADCNVKQGHYQYRLKQIDFDGLFTYSDIIEVEVAAPNIFSLEQNYPNPFNPSTKIKYTIPQTVIASETKQSQLVTLKIYDILGNEIATLVNEEKPAGSYEVEFGSHSGLSGIRELTSGIYFYQLKVGGFIQTKKMVLMK
jgi:hypothetical protein